MENAFKEVRPLKSAAVLCGADGCERPAKFLLLAAGTRGACWAYCEEHAESRVARCGVETPKTLALAGARY
jgi:hypothetical protein